MVGNLEKALGYEIAIAIRSGTDTDGTGRTITMLGPSVMVTGDDS